MIQNINPKKPYHVSPSTPRRLMCSPLSVSQLMKLVPASWHPYLVPLWSTEQKATWCLCPERLACLASLLLPSPSTHQVEATVLTHLQAYSKNTKLIILTILLLLLIIIIIMKIITKRIITSFIDYIIIIIYSNV